MKFFSAKCASPLKLPYPTVAAVAIHVVEHRTGTEGAFVHALVDEAQVFHAGHWKFLRVLAKRNPNEIFITRDSHQRNFSQRPVLQNFGIESPGRVPQSSPLSTALQSRAWAMPKPSQNSLGGRTPKRGWISSPATTPRVRAGRSHRYVDPRQPVQGGDCSAARQTRRSGQRHFIGESSHCHNHAQCHGMKFTQVILPSSTQPQEPFHSDICSRNLLLLSLTRHSSTQSSTPTRSGLTHPLRAPCQC